METLTKHYSSMCRSKTVLNHPQSTTIKSPYLPPIPTPPTPDCAQICQEMLLESWCLHARPPHARLIGGLAWGTDQEPRCERCLKEEEEEEEHVICCILGAKPTLVMSQKRRLAK